MSTMFREFSAGLSAFDAPLDARLAFLRRTYLHVAGAMAGFVALSALILQTGLGLKMLQMMSGSPWIVLGVFIGLAVIGGVAQSFARAHRPVGVQYAAFAGYVGIKSLIFAPILAIVTMPDLNFHPSTLPAAAGLTLLAFGGLTAFVLTTKKDFSFLGPFLFGAVLVVAGIAVVAMFTGMGATLSLIITGAMVLVALGMVLYTTSQVLHTYRTDEHVGAALDVFASIAVLFMYILQLLMQLQGGRRSE
jgi:FtsH-binding integral membrane protein